jgi:hypothetical protein
MPHARTYFFDKSYFSEIDTPDKAYWLGFITADGSVDHKALHIRLSTKDDTHLQKLLDSIGSDASIEYTQNNHNRPCVRIRVFSVELVRDLATHGILPNKTWTVKPWSGPFELERHFWRGVVDGDGWITAGSNGKTKRFYTVGLCGNYEIATGFQSFVHAHINRFVPLVEKHLRKNTFYQVAYTGTHAAKEVCQLLSYETGISLDRKHEKALEIIAYEPDSKSPNIVTMEEAQSIFDKYKTGQHTFASLAQQHNIGRGTVGNITQKQGRFSALRG